MTEPTLEELVVAAAQGSTNNGIQITTYADGDTEVDWLDGPTGHLRSAHGQTLREALERALSDQEGER